MPVTNWEEIQGYRCVICSRPASHFWLNAPFCCQCHGGNLCSARETRENNPCDKEVDE